MNAILVFNEKAGTFLNKTDGLTPDALRGALIAAGINVTMRPAAGKAIESALKQSVAEKPDALLVGGGDGTASAAAALLVGSELPLGVLPLGTLNHFAKDLGYPPDWRQAVTALAGASVQRIDVAEVNGRVFINNCSVGSYADAVRRRDALRHQKGIGKWYAMVVASLSVFRELRRMRLRIETSDATLDLRTPFLLVSNNRYTGHVLDASLRPTLNDGKLWLYTTRASRHGALLRMAWQSLIRSIDAADALEVHATEAASVSSPRGTLPAAADGEILNLTAPLKFRIRPKALCVLVPARKDPA